MKWVQNREKNAILFEKPFSEPKTVVIRFRGGLEKATRVETGRRVIKLPINKKVIKLWIHI